jgi:hypothetical protein
LTLTIKKKGRQLATDGIEEELIQPATPYFNEQLTMNSEQFKRTKS